MVHLCCHHLLLISCNAARPRPYESLDLRWHRCLRGEAWTTLLGWAQWLASVPFFWIGDGIGLFEQTEDINGRRSGECRMQALEPSCRGRDARKPGVGADRRPWAALLSAVPARRRTGGLLKRSSVRPTKSPALSALLLRHPLGPLRARPVVDGPRLAVLHVGLRAGLLRPRCCCCASVAAELLRRLDQLVFHAAACGLTRRRSGRSARLSHCSPCSSRRRSGRPLDVLR